MSKQKSKWILLSVLFIAIMVVVAILSKGLVASWLTKETLQSSVEISLLLQGDEADMYESPVTLMSTGAYKLAEISVKDTDGSYDGLNVSGVEPSRQNLYDYVMPGVNIPKDPKVFITKKSGAPAYLYIEVIEDNFPKYFTEEGFIELDVNNQDKNPSSISPIYYDLEDYWTPVYAEDGTQAFGKNGGKLYVYYNTNEYFVNNEYNKNFQIGIGNTSIDQGATYLSSYIMKNESTGPDRITKQQYYGTNEVKTVNGKPMDCPYFNILKKDTIYVSEKYIHSEYYSGLYTELGKAENRSETVKYGYDFGLYFNSYMASAKINGQYATPFDAFSNAGFISEKEYLIEQYKQTDPHNGTLPIYYITNEKEFQDAVDNVKNYSGKYKIVVLNDFGIETGVVITKTVDVIFDANDKTISAVAPLENNNMIQLKLGSKCKFTICGNGTFDAGMVHDKRIIGSNSTLIIENGRFIRDYNPYVSGDAKQEDPLINSGGSSVVIIKDGYFDNGYWCQSEYVNSSYYLGENTNKLLPVYDTINGGWLRNYDMSYKTASRAENGIYLNTKNADGTITTELKSEYKYGPCPRGICTAIAKGGDGIIQVLGGTFVVQNPAWGDELCAEAYTKNPYGGLYCPAKQGTFLEGQGKMDTDIPAWYEIIEGKTTYSYTDEAGNKVEFYVPTYTVKCDEELLHNRRNEAVQSYKQVDDDKEGLRNASGNPKASIIVPLWQEGRVVYVFDEEDLKLAVADYFGDGQLYKIVLMEDINVADRINVTNTSNFIFDMNRKTLSATSTTGTLMWNQNYSTATHSNVVIRGNGTFDLGNYNIDCFTPAGKLTIEDGNYIRDYDPERKSDTAVNYSIFNATNNSTVIIKGGYFDNGYWNLTGSITGTYKNIKLESTTHKVLPIYDTTEGKWLRDEDGNYIKAIKDGEGVKFVTVEGSKITAIDEHNPNYAFGPCARGFHTILNKSTTNSQVYVLGGKFVAQNPAWGNQMCAQDYIDNPFSGLYAPTNYGTFLYGQTYSYTAPSTADGYQELPAGYSIAEGSTEYSYVKEDGETEVFHVPTYTVSSDETVKDAVEALVK